MTLQNEVAHLRAIYEPVNTSRMPDMARRLGFLEVGIKLLDRAVENENTGGYGPRLASVFARWCAVTELLTTVSVTRALAAKYGGACSYCRQLPCMCPRDRSSSVPTTPSEDALARGIREWQQHYDILYGEKNRGRGIDRIMRRLLGEMMEVSAEWLRGSLNADNPVVMAEMEVRMAFELCDLLAWLFALANYLNVDLEAEVHKLYQNGCPRCKQKVCRCTLFDGTGSFSEKARTTPF